MLDLYTVATTINNIKKECKIKQDFDYKLAYQARPGMRLPIIINEQGKSKLVSAKWNLDSDVASITTKKILTKRPYNVLIRSNRCAVPANCFFGMKDKSPYLIRIIQPRLFLMGGLFTREEDKYLFSVLKTESPDLLSFLEYTPVLFTPECLTEWLKPHHLESAMYIADSSGNFWFDYFEVNSRIINDDNRNEKSLLQPIGLSQLKVKKRNQELTALAFDKERPNRRSFK
jgi:putative SOS response-associated peptidase YedK